MYFVRIITRFMFSLGALLMLLFSVCMLGSCAYSVFLIANGQRPPIPLRVLALAPWVGLAVLLSSCYILVGKYVWLFYTSASLLLLCIAGSFALIVAGLTELDWLGNGDELNMGLGVGSYCLFLLAGLWLNKPNNPLLPPGHPPAPKASHKPA